MVRDASRASVIIGPVEREISLVLSHYSLGRLKSIAPAKGGMTSDNWFVETVQGRYFLRRRNPVFTRESIEFEIGLIEHLVAQGFPTAPLIRTIDGDLSVTADGSYWELYEYLSGDRFNATNLAQVRSAAGLLADFHQAAAGYKAPPVPDRTIDLNRIERFVDMFEEELRARTKALGIVLAPPLSGFFKSQADLVLKGMEPLLDQPLVLIHGDFQPSNILFQGNTAAALLDFGDAGFSYRAYDLARAILRFATLRTDYSSQSDIDPLLDLERVRAFIDSYQAKLPLSRSEISVIPDLLRGVYLYDAGFFLGKETNPLRQIFWLLNAWQFSRLIDRSAEDLRELLLKGGASQDRI
ncbi:MAG: homoserine kinase [Methanotrichaceae archaeon]|nr:homoserine kinase [Methanotrichaceae archaeon]